MKDKIATFNVVGTMLPHQSWIAASSCSRVIVEASNRRSIPHISAQTVAPCANSAHDHVREGSCCGTDMAKSSSAC